MNDCLNNRYENYDYPPAITKPLASYVAPPFTAATNGISYRNLPLPRYHLDAPSLAEPANGVGTVELHHDKMGPKLLGVIVDPVLYARHFSGHDLRYQDERDRHNDSGYSTRPGESSQGPSPSLSGKCSFQTRFSCAFSRVKLDVFQVRPSRWKAILS